jgi:hypothetical protein
MVQCDADVKPAADLWRRPENVARRWPVAAVLLGKTTVNSL